MGLAGRVDVTRILENVRLFAEESRFAQRRRDAEERQNRRRSYDEGLVRRTAFSHHRQCAGCKLFCARLTMDGSGKRSLPMARRICVNTIGKLRKLRLPLPSVFLTLTGVDGL